jgi:predicted transcriptional regulator
VSEYVRKKWFDYNRYSYYNVVRGDEMRQTLTVRIPDELRKELKKISEEESKPVSDLVRESLKKYILIRKFRRLRNKVLPFAESQGILTDEDVFKLIS